MDGSQSLLRRIREVLLKEWDPIDVGSGEGPSDEYDAYITKIYELAIERRSITDVVEYLLLVESEQMGLKGEPERARRVAEVLVRLH